MGLSEYEKSLFTIIDNDKEYDVIRFLLGEFQHKLIQLERTNKELSVNFDKLVDLSLKSDFFSDWLCDDMCQHQNEWCSQHCSDDTPHKSCLLKKLESYNVT